VKNKDVLARFVTKPKTTAQLINTITPVKAKDMAARFNTSNSSMRAVVGSLTKRVINTVNPISDREMRDRFGITTKAKKVTAIAPYVQ